MEKKIKRIRRRLIVSAVALWILINFYYFWVKFDGGFLLVTGIVELISFIVLVVSILSISIRILKNGQFRTSLNLISIAFGVLIIASLNFKQTRLNENSFQSDVVIRACYEGTMNTSRLYFRENETFEDFNIGWFAFVNYKNGTWSQKNDSIFLNPTSELPFTITDTILVRDSIIYQVKDDTLKQSYYLLGNCRGSN